MYNTFTVLSKGFIDSQEKITSGKIFSIENAYRGILARLNYDVEYKKVPEYVTQNVAKIDPILRFLAISVPRYDTISSMSNVRNALFNYVNKIPNYKGIDRRSFVDESIGIDRYTGDNIHYFAKSLYQLFEFNRVAWLAFLLALGIDGLVLACGILGTSPKSLLGLKTTEELFQQSENAVQSAFLSQAILDKKTYKETIEKFQRLLTPSFEEAESNGIPATIKINDIKSNNMTGVIGLLVSLNLIFVPSGMSDEELISGNESLGVSLKLSLWLNEQLLKHSEASNSFKDFIKTTKSIL